MSEYDLLVARRDAIARGDKALGREIYHQLQAMGMKPEDIDAWTEPAPEPAKPEPEKAVRKAPEKR